jgi:hypothetical protein
MSATFKSGAFIQQCFAVHQLNLSLKKLALPDRIVLVCSACNMLHRLTIRTLTSRLSAAVTEAVEKPVAEHLAYCVGTHPTALGVRAVDVTEDAVGLRCAECRRTYDLDVASFETEQR